MYEVTESMINDKCKDMDRAFASVQHQLNAYSKDYEAFLKGILKFYDLADCKVEFDKKALYEVVNEGKPYEYFGRGKYVGVLGVHATADLQRPYSIHFRTEETDDDGRPVCGHWFTEMTLHDNPLELFKKYVLPYVKRVEEKE